MSCDGVAQAESMLGPARAELAAFLQGARKALGCQDPLFLGGIWIDALLSLESPEGNHEALFRAVSIIAAARIAEMRELQNREAAHKLDKQASVPEGGLDVTSASA